MMPAIITYARVAFRKLRGDAREENVCGRQATSPDTRADQPGEGELRDSWDQFQQPANDRAA